MNLLNKYDARRRSAQEGQKKILFVEKKENKQDQLSQILADYELLYAQTGEQALAMIKEGTEEISLIILNFAEAQKDGLNALKIIRENPESEEIPVMVMGEERDMEGEALELGAIDYLSRPYPDARVIRAKIANIFRFSESVRRVNAETYDEITGLLKMRSFLNKAEVQKRRHMKEGVVENYAIVFFDLADFKGFNMRYGIWEGDQCLRKTAGILTDIFPGELISRFADDHFVLIAPKERLIEKLETANARVRQIGKGLHLHLKCGIKYAADMKGETSIPRACDQAKSVCDLIVNEAEHFIKIYDNKISEEMNRREYIINHLDQAIEAGDMRVYLQPVVRSLTGDLCGAEALVRWFDPKFGFISPGEFIPILEDAQLIHKVDSFVIHVICKDYRRRIERNEAVVPVSFNLSRLDFELTDITQVIINEAERYKVPRDMLNVEITESMFVKDASKTNEDISRIKDAGFKVWMDDFGSGYSSLNLLKDYAFDELKIDMAFLSSFTEKSKNILKSIVRMAKEIGIQTLAEGVETKEQYEFLRSIGCEKIQGYYFGKPQPMEEVIQNCMDKHMHIETRAWASFYDSAGKINFMDERPFAIFHDDRKSISFMFANEAYMASLHSNGTGSLEEENRNINAVGTPLQYIYRQFAEQLIASGDELEITYPSGTQYMSLKGKVIAKCNGNYMYLVSLSNVTRNEDEEKQKRNDLIVRNIMYLYDAVSVVDLEKNILHNFDIIPGGTELTDTEEVLNLRDAMMDFAMNVVLTEDRQRFLEFSNLDTMVDRIKNSQTGVISSYLRCKENDGNYHWRVHSVMAIPKTDYKRFMIVSRIAPLDDEKVKMHLIRSQGHYEHETLVEESEAVIDPDGLLRNITNYSHLKFFWKDTQRRFLGVSQSFLDYYGLKAEEEVLGKTDEEMKWHVNDGPFRSDEIDVLEKGTYVQDAPGKCIIRGVLHNIAANKMPLYRDGKIIGLIGYFIDADAEIFSEEEKKKYKTVDLVTSVNNARGIMESFIGYNEEFRANNRDFVTICITVEGFEEFREAFGEDAGNELLRKITDILLKYFKTDATIGRLHSAKFIALYQIAEQAELQTVLKQIKDEIRAITTVGGHICTCFPYVETSFATDKTQLEEMVRDFWN